MRTKAMSPRFYDIFGTFLFALGFTAVVITPGTIILLVLQALRVPDATGVPLFLGCNLITFFVLGFFIRRYAGEEEETENDQAGGGGA